MHNKLIINTEFFLECYGTCSGCFLSEFERKEKETNSSPVFNQLKLLSLEYKNEIIDHLVIGFGRGNLLTLNNEQYKDLNNIINWCEENFTFNKVTFEISTSLIGKIDFQIENAKELISKNKNIFFNIIVNSEITSNNFWINLNKFYYELAEVRKSWGLVEDWGDIVVLNVSPEKLPEIDFIEEFVKEHYSPINISIFPYNDKIITKEKITLLNEWSKKVWSILHKKDFNVKNYLEEFYKFDLPYNPGEIVKYHKQSEQSYIFIDKNGERTNGIPSIMGEVDYPRLVKKYQLDTNIIPAYKSMQKNKACSECEVQKECLVSGAFLNYLANKDKIEDASICSSGYQKLFMEAKELYLRS